MKKFLSIIVIVLMAMLVFTGCEGPEGPAGAAGATGGTGATGATGGSGTSGQPGDSATGMIPGTYVVEDVIGYNEASPFTVVTTVNEFRIVDIYTVGLNDTSYMGNVAAPILIERILKEQTSEVDVVTGSTLTCIAIMSAVREALYEAEAPISFYSKITRAGKIEVRMPAVDILVIGGGAAGLGAAVEGRTGTPARTVTVIEKKDVLGGSMRGAAGAIRGIRDPTLPANSGRTEEQYINELYAIFMIEHALRPEEAMVRRWIERSLDALRLMGLVNESGQVTGTGTGRNISGGGIGGVRFLEARARELGAVIMTNTTGTGLEKNADGEVVRAYAEDDKFKYIFDVRRGVILAAGGYDGGDTRGSHDPYGYLKLSYDVVDQPITDAPAVNPGNVGDGGKMGADMGGALFFRGGRISWNTFYRSRPGEVATSTTAWVDQNSASTSTVYYLKPEYDFTDFPGVTSSTAPGTPRWFVSAILDQTGEQIDYTRPFDVDHVSNPGYGMACTMMLRARAENGATNFWQISTTVPATDISQWGNRPELERLGFSRTVTFTNEATFETAIDELVAWMDPPPDRAKFKQSIINCEYHPGGRNHAGRLTVNTLETSSIGTIGGLVINTNAQVVRPTPGKPPFSNDPDDTNSTTNGGPIPGLYAAGETANGQLMFFDYPMTGVAIGQSLTFGIIAAQHARNAGPYTLLP